MIDDLLQEKLIEYVKLKYPKRSKTGVRYVKYKDSFAEVMFEGGETLFFSQTFIDELKQNT